jgi:hypothetical protein
MTAGALYLAPRQNGPSPPHYSKFDVKQASGYSSRMKDLFSSKIAFRDQIFAKLEARPSQHCDKLPKFHFAGLWLFELGKRSRILVEIATGQ